MFCSFILLVLSVFGCCWYCQGRSYRTTFFPDFPLFFPRKTGNAGKTAKKAKVRKLTEGGQNIWNASHSNILIFFFEHIGIKKIARKENLENNSDKTSFDKNGPYTSNTRTLAVFPDFRLQNAEELLAEFRGFIRKARYFGDVCIYYSE